MSRFRRSVEDPTLELGSQDAALRIHRQYSAGRDGVGRAICRSGGLRFAHAPVLDHQGLVHSVRVVQTVFRLLEDFQGG